MKSKLGEIMREERNRLKISQRELARVLAWVEQQTESKLKKRFRGLRAVK